MMGAAGGKVYREETPRVTLSRGQPEGAQSSRVIENSIAAEKKMKAMMRVRMLSL
jgi:hypothetical protein